MMFDPALTTVVLRELIAAVSSWLRRRARRLGVKGVLRTGAVTVIQRFNSALGASPHFHTLFLDGVYSFILGSSVDVLLVPVGGSTTLDAYHATRVVDQLHPRPMVIPMHCRTDIPATKDLDPVDPFLERKSNVRHPTSPTINLTPVKARPATEIVVLPYR